MTYVNTRYAIYNVGTRSSTYNKTAIYNTNASTMAPRKATYNLDLRKPTTYNMNTRAAAPYHAASSIGISKTKSPYQVASSNQVASDTNTTQKTSTNLAAYNLGTSQLEYGLPSVTFDAIAKLLAPQQVICNVSTGAAASVIKQKATNATTRPSNSQMPASAESTPPSISRPLDSQTLNKVLEQPVHKKTQSVMMKPAECQIPTFSTDAKYSKSTTTELLPSSISSTSSTSSTTSIKSTKQLSLQISASTNNITSPTLGRFARPTTPKSASSTGTGNVFVKTRPNTVIRAELIKNKTTKRSEPASSVSRVKEDEYKSSKKPKPVFKTKLVNKYCTYYHKYGRCKEGDLCAYKHDPNRVEVCKLWLKGSECTLGSKCPLQHVESAHLIPYCRHFCKGMCLKDDCHYTHVKVSKRAPHCKDFMVGRYCPAGTDCRKKHEWGLYEEPTETESEAGKKRSQNATEDEVEREKIKKLREEMANGVNPFAAGWTFIPIDD